MQHNDPQYYYKPFFIPKWSKINDNYYYNTNNYGYIQELWYTRNKEITTKNHCSLIFNHIPYLTNNPGHFLQVQIIFGYLYNFLLFKWKENNLDKCGYFFSLNNSKSMINVISNLYSDIKGNKFVYFSLKFTNSFEWNIVYTLHILKYEL